MTRPTLEKWEDRRVAHDGQPASLILDEFDRVLADAVDERPLQTFFGAHGGVLSPLAPSGRYYWCLDRPRLGAELVPDFLLASDCSAGIRWAMVELESPTAKALTQAGLPAHKCAEALKQIRDWRTWLTDNVAYARQELGLTDLDAHCRAYVVIGRRNSLDPKQAKTYRALSSYDTVVMTYDRLRDHLARGATYLGVNDG